MSKRSILLIIIGMVVLTLSGCKLFDKNPDPPPIPVKGPCPIDKITISSDTHVTISKLPNKKATIVFKICLDCAGSDDKTSFKVDGALDEDSIKKLPVQLQEEYDGKVRFVDYVVTPNKCSIFTLSLDASFTKDDIKKLEGLKVKLTVYDPKEPGKKRVVGKVTIKNKNM